MGAITDHIGDTSIIGEALACLFSEHNLYGAVVDSADHIIIGEAQPPVELATARYYPFDFMEDIGGVRCWADSKVDLDGAEPHIKSLLKLINELLQKEAILSQSADEMLDLSGQLHFLIGLGGNLSGIRDLEKFCSTMLRETAKEVGACKAFAEAFGGRGKGFLITHNMCANEARTIRDQGVLLAKGTTGTKILALPDRSSFIFSVAERQDGGKGCIGFLRRPGERVFTAYQKQVVTIADSIVCPTIESLQLYESLQDLYINTVKALAAAIDAKDEYTHGHSFRVAKYSVAIGKKMKVNEDGLKDLEVAAYMHDLGKIGISEKILSKPGKLTDEEFEEIKTHPALTNKILQPIRLPDYIVDAAVQHHERIDGRGYPFGLLGASISPFAKIVAVADVFDALTSKRPYRDAMPVENALKIMCNGADSEFDSSVVLALLNALKNDEKDTLSNEADLRFLNVDCMNDFLVQLTNMLLGKVIPKSNDAVDGPASQ